MEEKYVLVKINSDYCDYLRKFDNRVSYNAKEKELRPFIGVLFEIENCKYFAPLSSPKKKHLEMKNQLDFYKLDSGKLGAINFNNMIPVTDKQIIYIDVNDKGSSENEQKYQKLLREQLYWLNRYGKSLRKKACSLYTYRITDRLPKRIQDRCCDFKLLEKKCKSYK